MTTIPDKEDETPEDESIQLKSHVIEGSLRKSIDRLKCDIAFLERYQQMEPTHRLEGFVFRCIRWYRKDYQSEQQRLENNKYLCNRLALVSTPIFILSAVPPTDSGLAVLSGLAFAGSFIGAAIFEGGLEKLREDEEEKGRREKDRRGKLWSLEKLREDEEEEVDQ